MYVCVNVRMYIGMYGRACVDACIRMVGFGSIARRGQGFEFRSGHGFREICSDVSHVLSCDKAFPLQDVLTDA
jgi:hypothetical protein